MISPLSNELHCIIFTTATTIAIITWLVFFTTLDETEFFKTKENLGFLMSFLLKMTFFSFFENHLALVYQVTPFALLMHECFNFFLIGIIN